MSVTDTLLGRHVAVAAAESAVLLNCAANVTAVRVIAGDAARVVLSDRSYPFVRAAKLALADIPKVTVQLAHGIATTAAADVVVIRTPREKLAAIQLLADAFRVLEIGGRCYLVGATNEGIKSVARIGERVFGNIEVLAHDSSHRIVVMRKRADAPADTADLASPFLRHDAFHVIDATLRGHPLRVHSRPGVFSWEHVDEATSLLADVMPVQQGNAVLDLGCGSGAIGTVAALLAATGQVVMVDADIESVRSAAQTALAAGVANVEIFPSDVASAVIDDRFDVVVTNPPYHAGTRDTDLGLPQRFIRDAHHVLKPGGTLALVANRTLPYEHDILQIFGNIRTLEENPRFKVLAATR